MSDDTRTAGQAEVFAELEAVRTKYGTQPATRADVIDAIEVALEIFEATNAKNVERNVKITALEQEVAALKAQPFLKDGGIWRHGAVYTVGDVAQFKGTRWVCTKAHTANGNPDHSCFQLWVKTGDAR